MTQGLQKLFAWFDEGQGSKENITSTLNIWSPSSPSFSALWKDSYRLSLGNNHAELPRDHWGEKRENWKASRWVSSTHCVVRFSNSPFSFLFFKLKYICFLGGSVVKNLPAMQETQIWSLGQNDSLEEEMATHFSILAWRIPWTEEASGLQSRGSQRVRDDWAGANPKHSWFTMLWVYSKLIQLQIYILFQILCPISYYKVLNIGPYTLQ